MRVTSMLEICVFVMVLIGHFVCSCGRIRVGFDDNENEFPYEQSENILAENQKTAANNINNHALGESMPQLPEYSDKQEPQSDKNDLLNLTAEEQRQWRIDMIKQQFLSLIPDLAPSNVTIPQVPEPLRYIQDVVVQGDKPEQPKVSQVVFFAEPAPAFSRRNGVSIFFNLDSEYASGHIHSVELGLYKERSHKNHTYVISKLPGQRRHHKDAKPPVLASERASVNPGWVMFKDDPLTDKIMKWVTIVKHFPNELGTTGYLMISCPTCNGDAPPISTEGDKKPFLAINFSEPKKRYKRRTQWCDDNQNSCCKKMFKFSFHDAGLMAFVEPTEYQPNYCQGSCIIRQYPETISMASSMYVSVIMQSRAFRERGKAPCCAPSKLLPITVLYYNRNMNLVRNRLENMVVESCGCH